MKQNLPKLAVICVILLLILGSGTAPQAAPVDPTPPTEEDYRTEASVRSAAPPARNLYELFPRLKDHDARGIQRVVGSTQGWTVGRTERFWVGNLQSKEYTQRPATLRHISGSAYWWVENKYPFEQGDLEKAADRFDAVVTKNRATFGSEWSPGVDNDPRIVVLVAETPGAGGYYSSADEYPRAINPFSNQHEMIYINAIPGQQAFDSTLAHEFQHMIHWNQHASQDVWLNEGMSEYATELNGLYTEDPGQDYTPELAEQSSSCSPYDPAIICFISNPDLQLNTWADSPDKSRAHYGQAYRFMSYLGARYGPEFMAQIIKSSGKGLDAVEEALRKRAPGAELSGVYGDWLAANYLANRAETPRGYGRNLSRVASQSATVPYNIETTVQQWGADYYALTENAPVTLEFTASATVPLVANRPKSGAFQWYSNRGDLIDTTLTREADLSSVQGATLEIDMWYDIEKDFDYGYVEVSTDNGRTWTTLPGQHTTTTNPNGNNLGNGFTGASNDWITERFDLTRYAGRKVLLRLEYVTDDGYNAQGMVIDGVRIPEIGLSDDSESSSGWTASGWIRSNNRLPARYRVLVVDADGEGGYTEAPVGADGKAAVSFQRGAGEPPVIVVSAASETTTQPSSYRLEIQPAKPGLLGVIGGRAQP